jgi:hypothetical protein
MSWKKINIKFIHYVAIVIVVLYVVLIVINLSPWDININNYVRWIGRIAVIFVIIKSLFIKEKHEI